MKKKINNKNNRTLLGFILFALVLAFTLVTVDGIIKLFGIDKLNSIGKIIIGAAGVLVLSYFANKFFKIKV